MTPPRAFLVGGPPLVTAPTRSVGFTVLYADDAGFPEGLEGANAAVEIIGPGNTTQAGGFDTYFFGDGSRIPMIVVSPFAKKNFVSHQMRDHTAILKLIEERFGLSNLTKRDAAQVPMDDPATGFFDFTNQNWQVPPGNLPAQTVLGQSACFVDPPPTSP